ncbi:MAG TPA: LysR family transcriptional regulator substrate-binding protein, partial [Dehalococcoidia bacterium]|nr:LysR family transcriptional regulator substrate-binding protein [Dehalococcoidia bacterium]
RILQTIQEARDSVAEVRGVQSGSLQIGAVPTIGTYLLPAYLRDFREKFPGIDISIRTGRSEQVLNMVLNDDVHLGIVRSLAHRDVEITMLYEDEIVLIANPDHPFARDRRAKLEDVAREPLILFERESSYYSLIQELFRRVGTVLSRRLELDSLEATKRMVAEGLGVALVPRITIEQELQLGRLVEVDIEKVAPILRPISMIHRRGRRLPHTANAFINVLTERYSARVAV